MIMFLLISVKDEMSKKELFSLRSISNHLCALQFFSKLAKSDENDNWSQTIIEKIVCDKNCCKFLWLKVHLVTFVHF